MSSASPSRSSTSSPTGLRRWVPRRLRGAHVSEHRPRHADGERDLGVPGHGGEALLHRPQGSERGRPAHARVPVLGGGQAALAHGDVVAALRLPEVAGRKSDARQDGKVEMKGSSARERSRLRAETEVTNSKRRRCSEACSSPRISRSSWARQRRAASEGSAVTKRILTLASPSSCAIQAPPWAAGRPPGRAGEARL